MISLWPRMNRSETSQLSTLRSDRGSAASGSMPHVVCCKDFGASLYLCKQVANYLENDADHRREARSASTSSALPQSFEVFSFRLESKKQRNARVGYFIRPLSKCATLERPSIESNPIRYLRNALLDANVDDHRKVLQMPHQ